MNKVKIILNYLVNFILAILLCSLVLSVITKNNIFNKEKLKDLLVNNNYYENISNTILESMQNYMVSSGLPETILNNIFTKDDVLNDINKYIDNMYEGKITNVDTTILEEKLNNNIDEYLSEHNVKINDENALKLFVKDIVNIYKKNISLYNLLNSYLSLFAKIDKVLNIVLIILVISILVLTLIDLFVLKISYLGSAISASGIILLFMKMLILDKINARNILIISDEFSKVIRIIYINIEKSIVYSSIILFILGLIVTLFVSIKTNKVLKKS